MRKSRFTEAQIIAILGEQERRLTTAEVPQARAELGHVLQVEVPVRRDGGLRRPQAEGS